MLPAEQCLSPDFFHDCNLISNFTTQHQESPWNYNIRLTLLSLWNCSETSPWNEIYPLSHTYTHAGFPCRTGSSTVCHTFKGRTGTPWCRTPHSLPQAMHERKTVFTKFHLFSELAPPKSAFDVLCCHSCVFAFFGLIFFFFLLFYMLDISLKPGGINSSFN